MRIFHFVDMARVQHSPGSDTQAYSSSDEEEWEKDEVQEAHEEHEEQDEGAAVTGAATTDLVMSRGRRKTSEKAEVPREHE